MLRKHAALIVAMSLIALVATACLITTRKPPAQRGQPVYVENPPEKHKQPKPEKHKKQKKDKH